MKISIIEKNNNKSNKLRACAYVRVSTNQEAQLHSFSAQREYWQKFIGSHEDYDFIGVFCDEGISGKNMRNRKQFLKMLELARNKEIDLICVKSVSRFGRNLAEVLEIVRELREKNVTIYFETENIYSNDPSCDMMLSLRAMVAEHELNEISENQKWAARKRFANGSVELTKIYGYDIIKEKGKQKIAINPEESKVVRRIYSEYLKGNGCTKIAKMLEEENIPTKLNVSWRYNVISYILRNEKYIGDALLQKSVYENYKKVLNNKDDPTVAMRYIQSTHEAIISKETFEKVQKQLNKRKINKQAPASYNPFRGIIFCGQCGKKYRHKLHHQYGGKVAEFTCFTYQNYGKAKCSAKNIQKTKMFELYISAYNEWIKMRTEDIKVLELEKKIANIKKRGKEMYCLMRKGYISKTNYEFEHKELNIKLQEAEEELASNNIQRIKKKAKGKAETFNDDLVTFVEKITISGNEIAFKFIDSQEVKRIFESRKGGNKKGWKTKQK